MKQVLRFIWFKKEAFIWIIALIALVFVDPYHQHYTLCPFHNLGWEFCPGCGIGRSIACAYRFDFQGSFNCHPLGIVALIVIIHRIIKVLTRKEHNYILSNTLNYGESI